MIFHTNNSGRALAAACALIALLATAPAGAVGATSTVHEKSLLGISIPPSARVGGTTGPTAASGAQPGTVAPGATPSPTTPATSAPTTTTAPPVATTPTATAPTTTNPTTTPTTSTPGAPTVVGVARKTTSSSTHLSAAALALAILGALLALGCAAWVVGRWMALEPRWMVSTMHSLREATYHASATWAEFSDWAKLGR